MKNETSKTYSTGLAIGWALGVVTAVCFIACVGCASPAQRVLRSVNDYEYFNARWREECSALTPTPKCPERAALLRKWDGAKREAGLALERGGDFPLQLQRLAAIEKEYPK
jgi:hypothetical protein